MSTYAFKAMDLTGGQLRGTLDADTKQAVSDQLKSRGLIVLEIAEKRSVSAFNVNLFQRVTLTELSIFSRQLATMVSSGMTILRSLFVLEEQMENEKLKETIVASARTSRRGCR
jgi:type IV pilus assembly protein PilC